MKLTYDPKYNIAYIGFREKTEEVTSIKISDELTIDLSSDGKVYGIELLNANEQLQNEPFHNLLLENSSNGKHKEVEWI